MLAAKRGATMSRAGLWELPGGKVELNESPEQALRRELAEELGLDVKVGRRVARSNHSYDDISIELTAFECFINSGTMALAEHEEVRWVTPEEAALLDWAPADVPIIHACFRTNP
jgi:8-oxo-dGTP diphosphatase